MPPVAGVPDEFAQAPATTASAIGLTWSGATDNVAALRVTGSNVAWEPVAAISFRSGVATCSGYSDSAIVRRCGIDIECSRRIAAGNLSGYLACHRRISVEVAVARKCRPRRITSGDRCVGEQDRSRPGSLRSDDLCSRRPHRRPVLWHELLDFVQIAILLPVTSYSDTTSPCRNDLSLSLRARDADGEIRISQMCVGDVLPTPASAGSVVYQYDSFGAPQAVTVTPH